MRVALGILAALTLGGTARAETQVLGEYGIWTLYRNDDNCSIVASYEDDNVVLVDYYAKSDNSHVGFTNLKAKSLEEQDERKLDVAFLDGEEMDDGWTGLTFTTSILEDGARMLISRNLDRQILDDVAEGRIIGFFYKDKLIGSYKLTGSKQAIAAMRKCALDVVGMDPSDPFLDR